MKKIFLLLLLCTSFSLTSSAQLNIGDSVIDIRLPDSLGKWKPLSDVKAKIILLDFWAAWCYPCVHHMPEVVQLYEKYHEKGLEIYAVSLDKDYHNWVNKCRELKMPFVLVNDVYGFNGKACTDYKITSIPNKLVLKDGKIIGTNMSLYAIDQMIEKELGSSK